MTVQAVPAVNASSSTAHFRAGRRRLWGWLWEVTIFKVSVRENIHLPGMPRRSDFNATEFTDDLRGHMKAAQALADHLPEAAQQGGCALSGFGRYMAQSTTTCGNNAEQVQTSLTGVRTPCQPPLAVL